MDSYISRICQRWHKALHRLAFVEELYKLYISLNLNVNFRVTPHEERARVTFLNINTSTLHPSLLLSIHLILTFPQRRSICDCRNVRLTGMRYVIRFPFSWSRCRLKAHPRMFRPEQVRFKLKHCPVIIIIIIMYRSTSIPADPTSGNSPNGCWCTSQVR